MASKDRIDSIIDREAIAAEISATKKDIDSLVKLIQSVKDKSTKVSGAKSFSEYNELKKQLDVLIKQTELSAKASINDAKAREINAKAALSEAKALTEAAKAKRAETQATEAGSKAKNNEQKLLDQAIDDYYQLSKAYDEAARKAQNYVLRLGENHPIAVQAIADASAIGDTLKKVDAAVGKFQRNVGNYKSAFDGLGFSFTQIGRELPSLAISVQTFATAISNNLPMVVDELSKAKQEIAALKAEGKDTPSLFSRVAKSIFSFQTLLSVGITLFTVFAKEIFSSGNAAEAAAKKQDKLTEALKNQTAALKDVIEENAQLNNQRLKQLENEKSQTEALGKSTIDIEKKIVAEKLKIAQNSIKQAEVLSRDRKGSLAEEQDIEKARAKILGLQNFYQTEYQNAINAELSNRNYYLSTKKKIYLSDAELEKKRADAAKSNYDFYKGLLTSLGDAESGIIEVNNKAAKEAADKAKEDAEKAKEAADLKLKTITEIKAIELQRIVDFNTRIAEDEERSLYARLAGLRRAKEAEIAILEIRAETEKKLGKKTKEEIALINTQLNADIERLSIELRDKRYELKKEEAEKIRKEEEKLQKDLEKLIADGYAKFKTADDNRLNQLKEAAQQRLQILTDAANQERELYKGLYDELSGLITDFFTAQDEGRIRDLENEGIAVDEKLKKDIAFINQTVVNRQDAAAQIAIVEAQALADKQELENKKKQIERNSANIERLAKLAEIAGTTASALLDLEAKAAAAKATAAVLAANPATAVFAPNALLQASLIQAQIPFLLGKAALQLARLAIPRFAEGGVHTGGLMYVGDGGKHEGIQLPDGTILKSPNTTTLMAAPPGTIIHKDYDKMLLSATVGKVPTFPQRATTDTSTPILLSGMKEITKAVKNIKQPSITVENIISKKIRGSNYLNNY